MNKRPMFFAALAAAGAVMMCGANALAQTGGTSQGGQNEMNSTSERMTVGDMIFINDAMHANAKEIVFGQLAMQKAEDRSVYSFAKKMVDDHMMMADKVRPWMTMDNGWSDTWFVSRRWDRDHMGRWQNQGENRTTTSSGSMSDDAMMRSDWWAWLTADDKLEYSSLNKLNGRRFDKAYIECQVKDHDMVLRKMERQWDRNGSSSVHSFIGEGIDAVRMHKAEAMRISFNYDDPFHLQRSWPW